MKNYQYKAREIEDLRAENQSIPEVVQYSLQNNLLKNMQLEVRLRTLQKKFDGEKKKREELQNELDIKNAKVRKRAAKLNFQTKK